MFDFIKAYNLPDLSNLIMENPIIRWIIVIVGIVAIILFIMFIMGNLPSILIGAVLMFVLIYFFGCQGAGFGGGGGGTEKNNDNPAASQVETPTETSTPAETTDEPESDENRIIQIEVFLDEIYINGAKCEDASILISKLNEIYNDSCVIELNIENAAHEEYVEVTKALDANGSFK